MKTFIRQGTKRVGGLGGCRLRELPGTNTRAGERHKRMPQRKIEDGLITTVNGGPPCEAPAEMKVVGQRGEAHKTSGTDEQSYGERSTDTLSLWGRVTEP